MGRHRSSLRDLGWGISNSPNPWKQGSAKRVVRALDYSNVHEDAAEAVPAPAIHAWEGGQENDPRLQHDSRQLESIREQLAAEDTENRRKLERLNGRIAELGEHKRGMWSVLGQQCKNILEPKLVSGPAASDAAPPAAAPAPAAPTLDAKEAERKLAAREATVLQAEAKLEARSREAERAVAARELEVAQKEGGLAQREARLVERQAAAQAAQRAAEATAAGAAAAREAALSEREGRARLLEAEHQAKGARLEEREVALQQAEQRGLKARQAQALAPSLPHAAAAAPPRPPPPAVSPRA